MSEFITMAHGNGGAAMQKLIQDYFVEAFANPILAQGEDQARIPINRISKARRNNCHLVRIVL